jgi:CoA:oxalate CoA-transferase
MTATKGNTGPLAGVRVLDVSIMAAGPWTAALLGMLGAEVIKVEPPAGDGTRWVMPTQRGMGTNFISMNVNKQDITLDMKTEGGRGAALALAASCDVFVQNFRVGVMERLGLDYASLKQVNPRLVYCAISGFGEEGPLAKAGCADPIMQAYSGFASLNGAADDDIEAFRFTGFVDLTTASVAAEAILAALLERETSGQGQLVQVSMLEAALEIVGTRIAEMLADGRVPGGAGSEGRGVAPDRAFQALDGEIFVTVRSDAEWAGCCKALEQPALAADARFATNQLRVQHCPALNAGLAPVFAKRSAIWWLRVLQRNGVPSALAHNFEMLRHHAQVLDNDMIATLDTADWGRISVAGLPWHFSGTPCAVVPPSAPGADTERVLAAIGHAAAASARKGA